MGGGPWTAGTEPRRAVETAAAAAGPSPGEAGPVPGGFCPRGHEYIWSHSLIRYLARAMPAGCRLVSNGFGHSATPRASRVPPPQGHVQARALTLQGPSRPLSRLSAQSERARGPAHVHRPVPASAACTPRVRWQHPHPAPPPGPDRVLTWGLGSEGGRRCPSCSALTVAPEAPAGPPSPDTPACVWVPGSWPPFLSVPRPAISR